MEVTVPIRWFDGDKETPIPPQAWPEPQVLNSELGIRMSRRAGHTARDLDLMVLKRVATFTTPRW